MRLISTKIWRAFPELDQYDDATCRRYIARARQIRRTGLHQTAILFSLVASLAFAITLASPHYYTLEWVAKQFMANDKVDVMTDTLLNLLVFVSFIWVPALTGLIVRDRLLHRCLRRHLDGAICPECRYSLIGLEIFGPGAMPRVRCPECGEEVKLNQHSLTEADINPLLA